TMLNRSLPLDQVQQAGYNPAAAGAGSGIQLAQYCPPGGCLPAGMMPPPGGISPPGLPGMPGGAPGGMPGMMGPGAPLAMGTPRVPGAVAAIGAITGGPVGGVPVGRTEVYFTAPVDMKVSWYAAAPGGAPGFSATALDVPGRYNFLQGAVYRLKLSNIPGLGGGELYPTLQVYPATHKTADFLAHSAVPVAFTQEDLEQVIAGNFVVKVIYLPDPNFANLATTGPDEVVSSRLEPGVDPIAEACRRGTILLVIRLGNINLELQHSPAMDAPGPFHVNQGP